LLWPVFVLKLPLAANSGVLYGRFGKRCGKCINICSRFGAKTQKELVATTLGFNRALKNRFLFLLAKSRFSILF